jgi:pyrroline-5-carboxylate reductase
MAAYFGSFNFRIQQRALNMSAALNCNICFIGGGNMAQALIGGLISRGLPPTRITVSDPVEKVRDFLAEKDIHVLDDNLAAIKEADIVVLAVKPQVLAQVLQPLKGQVANKLIISIVAGAEIATLARLLETDRIVRVMPNTPALVQTGAHGLYANAHIETGDRELASQVLASTGLTIWVNSEAQIDAVTAVSGSGPAYFFYMMESMIRAGKNLGLDEKVATALTLQTALGAAQMAITSSNTPAELRKNVTSPNGTTQAALEVFDRAQISQNIQAALAAAQKRSQELAQELSDSSKSSV